MGQSSEVTWSFLLALQWTLQSSEYVQYNLIYHILDVFVLLLVWVILAGG